MQWIAGYNLPTRSWSTGGSLSEYPREHWDLYAVKAGHRDTAQKIAQERRRKQSKLPESQLTLLTHLISVATTDGEISTTSSISLDPEEVRPAKALAAKGLITVDGKTEEAQLTFDALNYAPKTTAAA